MPQQWPQAKGSSGRQAETQVRLDALTRQSWGGGTVMHPQLSQGKGSNGRQAETQVRLDDLTRQSWGGTVMHPQLSQGKGSNGRQAETQVRLDALTRQSWGDGDASTVTTSQRKQRQASRDTSPAWCINTTVLGGTVMPPQWPQAKGSSGRQAETQVRLDALTRQSWGDGDASRVATSQRKQRQASRDTSPAWCLKTTVLGDGTVMHPQWPQAKGSNADKPRHKSGLMP